MRVKELHESKEKDVYRDRDETQGVRGVTASEGIQSLYKRVETERMRDEGGGTVHEYSSPCREMRRSFNLDTGLVDEFGQFREHEIVVARSQRVNRIVRVLLLLLLLSAVVLLLLLMVMVVVVVVAGAGHVKQ